MRSVRGVATALVTLYVMAVLQQTAAHRVEVFGVGPDLLLLSGVCLGMLAGRTKAAGVGFLAGLIQGAIAGANLSAYVVSRTFAAFFATWTKTIGYALTPLAVGVVVFAASLVAGVIWMFIGLRTGIGGFLGATIGTAFYNGILAIPLFALLRRVVDPPRR